MNNDIENDQEMEQFYIRFRDSMKNFYSKHSFTRPLKEWSEKLNILQREGKYVEIRNTIIKIISFVFTAFFYFPGLIYALNDIECSDGKCDN